MNRWLWVAAVGVASIAGGIAVAAMVAGRIWDLAIARSVARLHERSDAQAPPFSRHDLAGLPDPVVRYFAFALTPGQPIVRNARLRQVGEFAMRANSWRPFTAVEHFCVAPPSFLWDARIRMNALIAFYVRDGYLAGEGAMYGTFAAIVPMVSERGTSPMASGELLRYLAEAVLLPTALLPRNGVSWMPIDDNSARVTLTDGPTTVSCDVDFGKRGEIIRVTAMRHRDANATRLTPWIGRWSGYERVDGMMIPKLGEVEWQTPEGPFPYWRGRITDAQYEFSR